MWNNLVLGVFFILEGVDGGRQAPVQAVTVLKQVSEQSRRNSSLELLVCFP